MTAEEKLADYQTKAVDFVNKLCDPSAADKDVAWSGAIDGLAYLTLTDQMEGLQVAVTRLRKLNQTA